MKKDEKFIKDKLDILLQDDHCDENAQMPESLSARIHSLVQSVSFDDIKKQKAKKKKIFTVSFASACAAATCAVLCCVFLIPQKKPADGQAYYHDSDLMKISVTQDKFFEQFDVLMPNIVSQKTDTALHSDKKTNKTIYATNKLYIEDGIITFQIVFVKNYNITTANLYNNLPNKVTTDTVTYEYRVVEEALRAFAKFEYGNYRYYVDYSSEYPQGITEIMSTLTLK